jgi:hypothetical protein
MLSNSRVSIKFFILSTLFLFQFGSTVAQDLPSKSMRSKFRIQVIEPENMNSDTIKSMLLSLGKDYKVNTFLIEKKEKLFVHLGDFSGRDNAKNKLVRVKRDFPKAKVVKADNDHIVQFQVYERKKPAKPAQVDVPAPEIEETVIIIPELNITYNRLSFEPWNDEKYLVANSAENEDYLSQKEKDVFYYLNLVRMNPPLFADTYLLKHSGQPNNEYEISLYDELKAMEPLPCLQPNKLCWESAKCHAISAGEKGYVGHDRDGCDSYFWGECCQYGPSEPLSILLQLLIDDGVPSLGHRRICLGSYDELGVSIQPHNVYGSNAVLDFR